MPFLFFMIMKIKEKEKSTFIGLPQESNLGPVILPLFAKDMSKDITVGRTWTFADDVSHLINGNNLEDPTRSNLNEQTRKTNFCLIVIKSTLCFFKTGRSQTDSVVKLHNTCLQFSESSKY